MAGYYSRILTACFLVIFSQVIRAQSLKGEELLPPHRVAVNPATLVVSWDSPGYVLLSEDFEGESFPPQNWQASSAGKGWEKMDTILTYLWDIPAHAGSYALSNDDSASSGNQGQMDYLITPLLDLTAYDSLVLKFDSYFDGAYGQSALLEYSPDGGLSWILLKKMTASLAWVKEVVDLTQFSGPNGLENARFAFHSNDNGYNGSGWALDNIVIANSLSAFSPLSYTVLFDSIPVDTTTRLTSFIPTIEYTYGDEHVAGVFAIYDGGNSDTVFIPFESRFLFPAYDLHAEYCGQKCFGLGWSGPYRPPSCWPWELQSTYPTPDYYWTEGGCDIYDGIIYIVFESTNEIMKMDLNGNFVGMFNVPGVPPLTDIAHDYYDEIFYGVCGTNVVYKMDFETHTLIDQFTAPAPLHAIA